MNLRSLFRCTALIFLVLAPLFLGFAARADDYPKKPIQIIVPAAPGGILDVYTRIIASSLSSSWKQPVVVENKAGAAGIIGTMFVAAAPADGYTLVAGYVGSHAVNPSLFKQLKYDPVKDFAPVAQIVDMEGMLVVQSGSPIDSVSDLIRAARAQPGKLSYGSAGTGTAGHLAGELFKMMAQVDITHVPYKGNAPALNDLLGGQLTMQFATLGTAIPYVRSGRLKGLAVLGAERSKTAPETPTMAESDLPGYDVNNWIGLFAPAGTPPEIIDKLNRAVVDVLQSSAMRARMDADGLRFKPTTPESFGRFVVAERDKWARIIQSANIKAE